jgi:aldose 1-epimerase
MTRISRSLLLAVLLVSSAVVALAQASVTKETFGKTSAGETVDLYTLRNVNGMETKITNYGGIVVSLTAPDRNGKFADVVLGFNDLESYLTKNDPYMGAIIGRYGNRIAKGRFKLNGVEYKLAVNNGENHLHGGIKGFDKVIWTGRELKTKAGPAVVLTYLSKDGEEGTRAICASELFTHSPIETNSRSIIQPRAIKILLRT